jgi:hypothetical protein
MRTVIVVLYVLAAALPIVGFGRLLFRAQRGLNEVRRMVVEERGGSVAPQLRDLDRMIGEDITAPARKLRTDVLWDTSLVGVGLVAGAVASIWSLYL